MTDNTASQDLASLRETVMPAGVTSSAPWYADRAQGALVWDVEGREYIDFAGGIAVMNVGHCHPKVVAAIQDQAARLTHTCFMLLALCTGCARGRKARRRDSR